ncbi:MAG: hypothetical protein AAGA37_02150 [Actinomycetota bacterium]
MQDQELIATVAGAAEAVLPLIIDADRSATGTELDPLDVEMCRVLVRALVDSGASPHALHWTAEVLELTSSVMTHHRNAIPSPSRQAWNQVTLLFRTAGIAFAENVGRVPGTARDLDVDILHVTSAACRSMSAHVDYAALRSLIASAGVVLAELHRLDGVAPFPSTEVARVVEGLRPLTDHEHGS